jgi:hypothetical protein
MLEAMRRGMKTALYLLEAPTTITENRKAGLLTSTSTTSLV